MVFKRLSRVAPIRGKPLNPDRYIRAVESSNLRMGDKPDDATILTAAAYGKKSDPIGEAAIELLIRHDCGMDHAYEVESLVDALKRESRHGSRLQMGAAIRHWLSPSCVDCGGRGHRQIPDTPAQEDSPCGTCGGHGMRPHPFNTTDYAETYKRLGQSVSWAYARRDNVELVQLHKKTVLELLT